MVSAPICFPTNSHQVEAAEVSYSTYHDLRTWSACLLPPKTTRVSRGPSWLTLEPRRNASTTPLVNMISLAASGILSPTHSHFCLISCTVLKSGRERQSPDTTHLCPEEEREREHGPWQRGNATSAIGWRQRVLFKHTTDNPTSSIIHQ